MASRDLTNHPVWKVLDLELADAKDRFETAKREFAQAKRNADRTRAAYDKLAPKDPGKPESAKAAAAWKTYDAAFQRMLGWGDDMRKWQKRAETLQDESYRDRRRREFDRTHHSAAVAEAYANGKTNGNGTKTNTNSPKTKEVTKMATATRTARTDKAEYETKVVAAVEKKSNDSMAEVAAELNKAKVPTPRGDGKWEGPMVYAAYHRSVSQAQFTKTMERYKARKQADRGVTPRGNGASTRKAASTPRKSSSTPRSAGTKKTTAKRSSAASSPRKTTRIAKRDLAGQATPDPKPRSGNKKTTARKRGRK